MRLMWFYRMFGVNLPGNSVSGTPGMAFVFLIFFLLTGCSSHPLGPPGKGVLKSNQLKDLLIDLHYYDGLYENSHSFTDYFMDMNIDTLDFYQQIFEMHGVTRDNFIKSLNYYSYNPPQFEAIYNRVVDELSMRLNEADMEYSSIHDDFTIRQIERGEDQSPAEIE